MANLPITIIEQSIDRITRFELHVGTARHVAVVERNELNNRVTFNVGVAGPIQWPEFESMLVGMLELAVIADALYETRNNEKSEATRQAIRRLIPAAGEAAKEDGRGDSQAGSKGKASKGRRKAG